MNDFVSRKLKFKAWDPANRLLKRLDSIDCNKGELVKKGHILLQFTGLYDKEGDEIYEQDVMLINYTKYRVFWNEEKKGWFYHPLEQPDKIAPFVSGVPDAMKRFCSFFETSQ